MVGNPPDHLGRNGGSGGGNAYAGPRGNGTSTGTGSTYPGSGLAMS